MISLRLRVSGRAAQRPTGWHKSKYARMSMFRQIPRSGRSLEELVATIEGLLLGEGFEVNTRVVERDDDGTPIAELDVEARGQLGSSSIRWVFECRDRPSEGPAGVHWIEQLIARRDRLRLDKMFAVSTTGFSEPARRLADDRGITLRTVSDLSDLSNDFKVQIVTLHWAEITSINAIDIRTDPPTERGVVNAAGARVRLFGEPDFRTFADFLDTHLSGVPPATEGSRDGAT
jgi:hypothetical protein